MELERGKKINKLKSTKSSLHQAFVRTHIYDCLCVNEVHWNLSNRSPHICTYLYHKFFCYLLKTNKKQISEIYHSK